jgi:type IV secretory pathway TraG/TraD family ATPase VirD4
MTAQEIKQLPDEKVIVFHKNYWPFIATRMDYRRFPELVKRRNIEASKIVHLPGFPVKSQINNGFAKSATLFLAQS